jgi:hypothetical protein
LNMATLYLHSLTAPNFIWNGTSRTCTNAL